MKKRTKLLTALLAGAMFSCSIALVGCQGGGNDTGSSTPEESAKTFDEATGLNFELSDNGLYYIVIQSPNCNLELEIPAKFNELPVREIADGAFQSSNITSLTLPDSIDVIGRAAFASCNSLKSAVISDTVDIIEDQAFCGAGLESITIGRNVQVIGDAAFSGCSNLETVTLPDSVTSLGKEAFHGCPRLSSVVLGNGLETIERLAFANCPSLLSITIGSGVKRIEEKAFEAVKGVLTAIHIVDLAAWCEIDGLKEIMDSFPAKDLYVNNEEIIQLEIPDGVTEIKEYAFHNCGYITWATIPSSVERIGEYAFTECFELEGRVKNALTYLGNDAEPYLYLLRAEFKEVTNQVVIDKDCRLASPQAFEGCNALVTKDESGARYIGSENNPYMYLVGKTSQYVERAIINANCKFMGEKAFQYCSKLESMVVPEGIELIPNRAFQSCSALKSLTLPANAWYIGESAFDGCQALTALTIPEKVTKISPYMLSTCKALTSLTIHDGITGIGRAAFQGCPFTSITLPRSITYIDSSAFYNCKTLATLNFEGTMAEWESISKDSYWKDSSTPLTIICSDGTIE